MSGELSGKVSIITGASSGIGQATAVMFARKGAMVTLCGRDQDRLKAVQEECTQASGGHHDRFITVQGDLTEAKVREDIVTKTIQNFGRLDILVPNAGANFPGTEIGVATEDKFDAIFDINLKSVFFLIQAALSHLEITKGNIVSTSSIITKVAHRRSLIYGMSKKALDHMTRCLALDLGPKGIRVNAVNPSYIGTRIARNSTEDVDAFNEMVIKMENQRQPMGACGTVEDVAQAICFLASDSAKFITGECLDVDGGRALAGP